eukprot:s934_g30.t1
MPLTAAESMELQRLLAKAKSKPGPPSESSELSGIYDPNTGLFVNPVTGETVDVWTAAEAEEPEVLGAMTDGSKRREEQVSSREPKRFMQPQAKAHPGVAMSQGVVPVYMQPGGFSETPFPDQSSCPGFPVEHAILPPLPDGVPDVDTWSHTLIEFGQYKNASMSYQDLVDSKEARAVSYVKWCRSRSRSATGQLKDLCDFLTHHFAAFEEDSGPIIPGTGTARRFKK